MHSLTISPSFQDFKRLLHTAHFRSVIVLSKVSEDAPFFVRQSANRFLVLWQEILWICHLYINSLMPEISNLNPLSETTVLELIASHKDLLSTTQTTGNSVASTNCTSC